MRGSKLPENEPEWRLRRASDRDVDALHALLSVPEVYRYLMDGVAPPRWRAEKWIELDHSGGASNGLGLWLLERTRVGPVGCVGLAKDSRPRTAELIYLLHPAYWGQGLATRMSWTVIESVFRKRLLEQIVAGADEPNQASVAVMKRLGMGYLRGVRYPLSPGAEYVLRHDDPQPTPLPDPVPQLE